MEESVASIFHTCLILSALLRSVTEIYPISLNQPSNVMKYTDTTSYILAHAEHTEHYVSKLPLCTTMPHTLLCSGT
jgi:hypothetical protein